MLFLRSLVFNLAFFSLSALCALGFSLALLLPRSVMVRLADLWAAMTEALLAGIVGLRMEVRGRENLVAGPAVIASKHQSAWETILFPRLFPGSVYVVKQELLKVPLYGRCLARAGAIGVDRKGGARALKGLIAGARRALAAGRQVIIFPEGTRAPPGGKRPYHPGVAALYTQLGVPVVPVALNSGLFWGKRSFLKRPGVIVVEILPPIAPGLDRRRFQRELEERIETATMRLMAEAGWRPPVDKSVEEPRTGAIAMGTAGHRTASLSDKTGTLTE